MRRVNPHPVTIFMPFTSAAYIQMQYRLDFNMEANNIVLSESILFAI